MITFEVPIYEVHANFPSIKKTWIGMAKKYLKKDIEENEFKFYYTCIFRNNINYILVSELLGDPDKKISLTKDDLYIDLTMKFDKFVISDRMVGDFDITEIILDNIGKNLSERAKSITFLKGIIQGDNINILYEGLTNSNTDISGNYMQDFFTHDTSSFGDPTQFDIDEILDKISSGGIESLTKEEMKFLNETSERENNKRK